MVIIQPQVKEKAPTKNQEKKQLDLTVPLILLTVTLSVLDFYSHPHGGLADLERRQALEKFIGFLADYIGNYGFSAALTTVAAIARNFSDLVFKSDIAKTMIKRGYQISLASIITLNALVEGFSNNNQFWGDVTMGTLGVFITSTAIQLLMNKFNQKNL